MLLKIDVGVVLALSAALSLTGCSVLQPELPPPPPAPVAAQAPPAPPEPDVVATTQQAADDAARRVLGYHERVRQMSAPEVSQELIRLNGAPGGPATTLETVLALGQSRSNGDLARALSLLDSLLRINTPEVTPWQPIARLLAARFSEQRKLEEQLERLNTQLKDNQRDSQRKIDQLNEKLEALKAIERSLTVRPPAVAVPPTKAP